jgi:hypothetical protein
LAGATKFVEALLAAMDRLDGGERRQVLFTCHQVLARTGDSRAPGLLVRVYDELQTRAATITDADLRRSFLDNVPLHREIVRTWAAQQAALAATR